VIETVNLPKGSYSDAVWLNEKQLVVRYQQKPEYYAWKEKPEFWLASINDGTMRRIELPQDNDDNCFVVFFGNPVRVVQDQMIFGRQCSTSQLGHVDLIVWDALDGTTASLYNYDLPFEFANYSFSPDPRIGVFASNTSIEDRLRGMDASGVFEIDISLVRANRPVWSPDGQLIAFFGNQKLSGPPGPDWATQPYDLYLMPASCVSRDSSCNAKLEIIVEGITDELSVRWSPDGQWLAFDGTIQGSKPGIWLLELETKQIIQVAEGSYGRPEWSPDGRSLVVLGPPEPIGKTEHPTYRPFLYSLDVSTVVTVTK
jgi:hypothetical protein